MKRFVIGIGALSLWLLAANPAAAYFGPGGRLEATLLAGQDLDAGKVAIFNTKGSMNVEVETKHGWLIQEIQIFLGNTDEGSPSYMEFPITKAGNVNPGGFPYKKDYAPPTDFHSTQVDFTKTGFAWGSPYKSQRLQRVAVHAELVQLDLKGKIVATEGAWAYHEDHAVPFPGSQWGWWLHYEMAHPAVGHFWDSPVVGLSYATGVGTGITGAGGKFEYFPGEPATFALGNILLGTAVGDHRVTPLDLFDGVDLNANGLHLNLDGEDQEGRYDNPAVNVARLLLSLDNDGIQKNEIYISEETIACLNAAAADLGLTGEDGLDFRDGEMVDLLINDTINCCKDKDPSIPMTLLSAEEAAAHLTEQLSGNMFRKNVSKRPEMATSKGKLDAMPVLVPARKANGDLIESDSVLSGSAYGVDYFDEEGNYLYTREKVRPLVSVYAGQIPETGMSDVFGAVSRDDGRTWKRKNLSRSADRSSFTLANGQPYYGDVKKPILSVKGNYILVAWQGRYARGGRPRYSIQSCPDEDGDGVADPCITCRGEGDNEHCDWDDPADDIYQVDDIWGVGGPQRSHDYTEEGFPEVGELPYHALWACRGVIDPATGDVSWRKPERLTSGRRDVYQISVNGAKGVGFAIVHQEDPEGVKPGEAAGPGHGWSGATTNHKTDIWYSFIPWADFAKVDENFSPNGDPEHAFDDPEWTTNRPMPLVPFSLPVRLSDNDVCNTDNLKIELDQGTGLPPKDADGNYVFTPILDPSDPEWDGKHTGTHRYAYLIDENANGVPDLCADFHTFVNEQGATKNVCISEDLTADGIDDRRLLDGDTGASRANISFMPFTKADGKQSAWVSIAYEESKGVGSGKPEWDDDPDTTHFEEKDKPDLGKNVIYHTFEFGNADRVSGGNIVNLPETDDAGNVLYLVDEYGNDLLDWKGDLQFNYENARRPRMLVQPPSQAGGSNTVMVLLYKQGKEGKGRPSDIFMRRVVNPKDGQNPYAFKNIQQGAQNISSVTPTETWENPNQDDQAKGEGIKVVRFEQREENLDDLSSTNPYDDARAHRGILRGDNLFVAYTYTPNWAASRNAHDKYDLYIRRSFNGGKRWTTDPDGDGDVKHTCLWKEYYDEFGDPVVSETDVNKKETIEEVAYYAPGDFEPARNISLLKNNKLSTIEPRLVGPSPGKIEGSDYPEDKYNRDVFYLAWGTETNVPKAHGADEDYDEVAAPVDLFYTFTRDRGQTFYKRLWEINPDSDGNYAGQIVERYDYLAKGDPEQGEAQIRMSPDGSRFYAVWNEDGAEGNDCIFRRIMSGEFRNNRASGE